MAKRGKRVGARRRDKGASCVPLPARPDGFARDAAVIRMTSMITGARCSRSWPSAAHAVGVVAAARVPKTPAAFARAAGPNDTERRNHPDEN